VRVLSFDPGAARMGFALLETGPQYLESGIVSLKKETDETYQQYRLRLITFWAKKASSMLRAMKPDIVVSEIVPVKGFSDPSQAYLAGSAISAVQTITALRKVPNVVVSASSVKASIAQHKATKVQVRNAVIDVLPELEHRRKDWTKVFDECDAIAIGLYHLRNHVN
jgi:Holliday junction resolvasome RuvABC endonuclease subunit